jgi:hypothetical protein
VQMPYSSCLLFCPVSSRCSIFWLLCRCPTPAARADALLQPPLKLL